MSRRDREGLEAWLTMRIQESERSAEKAALEAAYSLAAAYKRSLGPLGTLARLLEACDAIVSGDAGALAEAEKLETQYLLPGRTPLNNMTVAAYVRLRRHVERRREEEGKWNGPAGKTIQRTYAYRRYLVTRQELQQIRRRPSQGSKQRRIEEILGSIEPIEARQDLRFELDKGITATRQLAVLTRGLADAGIDLTPLSAAFESGDMNARKRSPNAARLEPGEAQQLAQVAALLQDNDQLRNFELMNDGFRIKLNRPPATTLLNKQQLVQCSKVLAFCSRIDQTRSYQEPSCRPQEWPLPLGTLHASSF